MPQLFSNNGSSTLLNPVGPTDTQATLQPGDGDKFPPIGATSDFFVATMEDALGNVEIVTCTARSGDTITIIRAAEGTTALPFAGGDRFELRVTAETLKNFAQKAGDTFTGVTQFPGIDILTSDATNHLPWTHRYTTISSIPTYTIAGPPAEVAAMYFESFKAAGEIFKWGVDESGRQLGTGANRYSWYGKSSADPDWFIDATNTKPGTNQIQREYRPSVDAINVSYLFEVVDAGGVRREVRIGVDGSITSFGPSSVGSVKIPLADDTDAEELNITFALGDLFGSAQQRTISFTPDNISGDLGDPNTAIQYNFITRQGDGTLGVIAFYPDGSLASSGQVSGTKMLVGTQGAPNTLAPNELITKQYAETNFNSNPGGSGYFAEVLYESVPGVSTGSFGLSNPLITVGPPQVTHYQQVIIEASVAGQFTTITLDTNTMRLATVYCLGAGFLTDSDGRAEVNFTDYQTISVTPGNAGLIHRIIGVSYAGDPFP